jgi:hypothetical protein
MFRHAKEMGRPTMTLQNHETAVESLRKIIQDQVKRTEQFAIDNASSQFELTLVLAEGYYEAGQPLPLGYVTDTGLTVTGQNVMPIPRRWVSSAPA